LSYFSRDDCVSHFIILASTLAYFFLTSPPKSNCVTNILVNLGETRIKKSSASLIRCRHLDTGDCVATRSSANWFFDIEYVDWDRGYRYAYRVINCSKCLTSSVLNLGASAITTIMTFSHSRSSISIFRFHYLSISNLSIFLSCPIPLLYQGS
jgi:hypothetical protein